MQIVSNIALITINETLIVQLVSFLLFLFIINRIMFRPLRKVMTERSTYIETLQREIADQQNELKKISKKIKDSEQKVLHEAHVAVIKQEDVGQRNRPANHGGQKPAERGIRIPGAADNGKDS